MNWSIKLLKVKGIDIKVHLTFVLILIWAAYRWGSSSGAGWQGALFGVVVTLLLFLAVTLHELGHSFQALKYGVQVQDITLLPMGGLARMEEIPEKPSQELRIALAGPLVNFGIVALLVGLGILLQARSVVSLEALRTSLGTVSWAGMLSYLTMANLALGVFNLIPAFPMDGGRVLRAALAMRLDYDRATAIAVTVGQGLAWLLGLYGFLSGSYTLILIAIFVWMGAGQEGKQVELKSVLRDYRVGQAMSRQPLVLSANDRLERAVELTLSSSQVHFPVIRAEDGLLAGLLTEGDLLRGLRAEGEAGLVGKYMQADFLAALPYEPLVDAHQRMAKAKIQAMPVLDENRKLAGLLTAADLGEAYRLIPFRTSLEPVKG